MTTATQITLTTTTETLVTVGCHGIAKGEEGYTGFGGNATFRVAVKQADGQYLPVAKCHDADDGTRWARRQMKRSGGEYMVIRGRKIFWLTSDDAKRAR